MRTTPKTFTSAERQALFDLMIDGDEFQAVEAAEKYYEAPHPEDLPRLIEAYEARKWDSLFRSFILDSVGVIGTPEASDFLQEVARSKTDPFLRYDAMRYLIELGKEDWCPPAKQKIQSDLYDSLRAYERYRKGEITFNELRQIAFEGRKGSIRYWDWILNLDPRPGDFDR